MPVCPRDRGKRGTTLLELMVALTIAGLALLASRYLIEEIDDAGTTMSHFARNADQVANGERLLRATVARAEVNSDSSRRFRGDSALASFDTWCERPSGWTERCRVALTIGLGRDSSTVTGVFSTGEILRLTTIAGAAMFRYVSRDSSGRRWLDAWGQSITAPFALTIESDRDTIILVVGERG